MVPLIIVVMDETDKTLEDDIRDASRWIASLTHEQRVTLFACRPDRREVPPGEPPDVLARRLFRTESVTRLVGEHLPAPALAVLQTVLALGAEAAPERVRDLLEPDCDDPQCHARFVTEWLNWLADHGLVWPPAHDPELVRVNPAVRAALPVSLGLGLPAMTVLGRVPDGQLRRLGELWDVRSPSRAELIGAVAARMADAPGVRRRLAGAPGEVVEAVLGMATDTLVHAGLWPGRPHGPAGRCPDGPAARWLVAAGFAVPDPATWPLAGSVPHGSVPAEIILSLSPLGLRVPFTPAGPDVPTRIATTGAGDGRVFAEAFTAVLEAVERDPLAGLRTGEIGTRALRDLARSTGVTPGEARLALELAYWSGLIGWRGTPPRLTTAAGWPEFAARPPAERARRLMGAWFWMPRVPGRERDDLGRGLPALGPPDAHGAVTVRREMIDRLASLRQDRAVAEPEILFAALRWQLPRLSAVGAARELWREAEVLGVVVGGRLSDPGRVAFDDQAAPDPHWPQPVLGPGLAGIHPAQETAWGRFDAGFADPVG